MKSIMLALLLIPFSNFTYAQDYWVQTQPYPVIYYQPVVYVQLVPVVPVVPMVPVIQTPPVVQPYYHNIVIEKRGCLFPKYITTITTVPSAPIIRY